MVARSTSGAVRTESDGSGAARTVNGDVTARTTGAGNARQVDLETTNGSVVAERPDGFGAEASLTTENGAESPDLPVALRGRVDPRRLTIRLEHGSRQV